MHKGLLAAVAATTLFCAALLPGRADAMGPGGAAVGRSAHEELGLTEQVRIVCRRFFDDGVWVRRCFRDDDDVRVFRDRDRDFRDRDRVFDRDRDRDRFRRERDCDRVGPVVVCH